MTDYKHVKFHRSIYHSINYEDYEWKRYSMPSKDKIERCLKMYDQKLSNYSEISGHKW